MEQKDKNESNIEIERYAANKNDAPKTSTKLNFKDLRKKVDLLCNTFCAVSAHHSKEEMEEKKESYEALIIKEGIKGETSELMQILRVKALNYLYEEIVEGDFVGKARRRGFDQTKINELKASICTNVMERLYSDSKKTIEELKENLKEETETSLKDLYQPWSTALGKDGKKIASYVSTPGYRPFIYQTKNETLLIKPIGRVIYQDAAGLEEYVTNYSVTRQENNNKTENSVFGTIELGKMGEDEKYFNAVIELLLSKENINRKDSMGYIGELQRFQVDGDIEYEHIDVPEDYTAVVDYFAKQQTDRNTNSQLEDGNNKKDTVETEEIEL